MSSSSLQSMSLFSRLATLAAFATPLVVSGENPPPDPNCENSAEYQAAHPEECCQSGSGGNINSLGYFIEFGGVPFEGELSRGRLAIHQEKPTPSIFTAQSVRYESIATVELQRKTWSTSGWDIKLVSDQGRGLLFHVPQGSETGVPSGASAGAQYTITLLGADRMPVAAGTSEPAYVRLNYKGGQWLEIDFVTNRPVRYKAVAGRLTDFATLPVELTTDVVLQDSVLRQVKAPQGLADFVQIGDQAFEMRFYTLSSVGLKDSVGGLYSVSGMPYRVVRIENAVSDPTVYDHVKVTETWGTRSKVYVFDYNDAVSEWQLTQGGDTHKRIESKSITPGSNPGETVIVRTLKDQNGATVSTTRQVKREFGWGKVAISETKEPDTLNLTTTYAYYENSAESGYAKLRKTVQPDGSWKTFVYDAQGRQVEVATPWKDTDSSQAATGPRVIVRHSYDPLETDDIVSQNDQRPRTTTESIVTTAGGDEVVTKRTYFVYKTDASGVYTEIEERAATSTAAFGASGNLRSTRVYYTTDSVQSDYDPIAAGRLRHEDREDGVRTSYTYARDLSALAASYTISEVITSPTQSDGIDGLSTRTDRVHDVRDHEVEIRHYTRASGAWQLVRTETRTINDQGFHVASHSDGRQTYAATYNGDRVVSRTREDGVVTALTYDDLDKVVTETRLGAPAASGYAAQSDIVTVFMRDLGGLSCGCDGEVTAIATAGSLSLETVVRKDLVGRLAYEKDPAGLETRYSYALGGRQVTRTNPDGGTTVSLKALDRRDVSVTGTGTVAYYFDYGVDSDGTRWTKVSQVAVDGPRWVKTSVNLLNQVIREEKPAYDGGMLVTSHAYDAQGRRIRTRQRHLAGSIDTPVIADTLTTYDALGNVTRTGLDIDGSGMLEAASVDRITDHETAFELHDGAWWRVARNKVFPNDNDDATVTVSEQRQRLSGFSGDLTAESVALDVHGNATRQKLEIAFAQKLRTETTTHPDSAVAAVRVRYNDRLVSENTKTVAAVTLYGHDALGRVVSIKEPRHQQASTITYDLVTGQVIARADAAGNSTVYAYYANGVTGAGRLKVTTNALGHTERVAYDLLGRVIQKWGTAVYPQAYSFSLYGQLSTLTTWRDVGAANLDASTWPAPAGGDVTTWSYQASTGLMTRKQYADGNGPDYAYDALGRLSSRLWARSDVNGRIATAYGYDAVSGLLTSIDYSDATPDVGITYTRFGAQKTVTDATGTRTFTHNAALQPEQEQLPEFFGNRILTRIYQVAASASEPTSVPGRNAGFELGVNGDLDQDHAIMYGFDSVGRSASVASAQGTFTYGYSPNGDLRASVTGPVHTVSYGYEPNRDALTSLENKVGTTTVSKFDYTVNAIAQRSQRSQSGTAFGTASADVFGYNTRGELTGVTNAVLPSRDETYVYDAIGNRASATTGGDTTNYTANSLNQYTQVSGFSSQPSYDADGNMIATGTGRTYTWDAENRLIAVEPLVPSEGAQRAQNTYDSQSRRVRRQIFIYATGTWSVASDEKFTYDGWNVAVKYDGQMSGFSLQAAYTWGLDLSGSLHGAGGVGGLLAVKDGNEVYCYTCDANGNVIDVLDAFGAVAAHYEYGVFGHFVASIGGYATSNEYRFSTKQMDAVGGLCYYGLRYYDPGSGRWVNRDVIEELGGVNLYGFVVNSPVGRIDLYGLTGQSTTVNFSWSPNVDNVGESSASATVTWTCDCAGDSPNLSAVQASLNTALPIGGVTVAGFGNPLSVGVTQSAPTLTSTDTINIMTMPVTVTLNDNSLGVFLSAMLGNLISRSKVGGSATSVSAGGQLDSQTVDISCSCEKCPKQS